MSSTQKKSGDGSSSSGVGDGGQQHLSPPLLALGYHTSVHNLSEESWRTLRRVNTKRRRMNTFKGTNSALFDNSSPRYSWLLSGWVVEERSMPTGRVYRYYYDPLGQMYNSRQAAVAAHEACGRILSGLNKGK